MRYPTREYQRDSPSDLLLRCPQGIKPKKKIVKIRDSGLTRKVISVNVLRMFFNNCFGSGVTLIIFSARYLVLLGVFFISVIRSLVICLEPSL